MGKTAEQFKQTLIFNDAFIFQFFGNIVDVAFGNGFSVFVRSFFKNIRWKRNNGGFIVFVQCQHIRGCHPCQTGNDYTDTDDEKEIHNTAHASGTSLTVLPNGSIITLRILLIISKILIHLFRYVFAFFFF